MKRLLLFIALCGLFWGCEENATTTPGVFVPNLEGNYDLTNVTADPDCVSQFDATADITQDEAVFVLQATNPSFTNLNGTIDEAGAIVATGATNFATPFECTGQFAAETFSGLCHSQFQVCTVDAAGDVICVDASIDCAFSYVRN